MHIERLWAEDFRNYEALDLTFPRTGLTLIEGSNGQGKTNLLEAIGYVATLRSFRGASSETLVRHGADRAVVRGEGIRDERRLLIETEISTAGRSRAQINRQAVRRARDLHETLMATVFSPDDLDLVKGGPAERRRFVDELLADGDSRLEALERDLDRILRQRNTLLRQASGRLGADVALTLDVWDAKFAEAGEALGRARAELVEQLQPIVAESYAALVAPERGIQHVGLRMSTEWRSEDGGKGLAGELEAERKTDVARGVTTVGPHRDEVVITVNGMPARSHASQGEQRTVALALRLAAHRTLTSAAGAPPVLLLDDVFSELDDERSRRLLDALPQGQTFLTAATGAPAGATPELRLSVSRGSVT